MKSLLLTIVVVIFTTTNTSLSVDVANQQRLNAARYQVAVTHCTEEAKDADTQELGADYLYQHMTGMSLPSQHLKEVTFERCMNHTEAQ